MNSDQRGWFLDEDGTWRDVNRLALTDADLAVLEDLNLQACDRCGAATDNHGPNTFGDIYALCESCAG